jgi:hypothetical protein
MGQGAIEKRLFGASRARRRPESVALVHLLHNSIRGEPKPAPYVHLVQTGAGRATP